LRDPARGVFKKERRCKKKTCPLGGGTKGGKRNRKKAIRGGRKRVKHFRYDHRDPFLFRSL